MAEISNPNYDEFLSRRLDGLDEEDLRNLSDLIIDKLRNRKERHFSKLSKETCENLNQFVASVNSYEKFKIEAFLGDLQIEEIEYCLAKAKQMAQDVNQIGVCSQDVWDRLEILEEAGRLTDKQLEQWDLIKSFICHSAGVEKISKYRYFMPKLGDCEMQMRFLRQINGLGENWLADWFLSEQTDPTAEEDEKYLMAGWTKAELGEE